MRNDELQIDTGAAVGAGPAPGVIALNPKQVYAIYGIQPFTIRKMVRDGRVRGRTGKPFLVDARSLREWYESGADRAAA